MVLGTIAVFAIIFFSVSAASAQSASQIPPWVKAAVTFWVNDQISDQDFIGVIQYFIENEIIIIPQNDNLIDNLQTFQIELNGKIQDSRVLANNIQVQNSLVESNELFGSVSNVESAISQLDDAWKDSDPEDPESSAYNLIHNEIGDIIRQFMQDDQESESRFKFAEVIITNAYGVNVGQSGKTSDYMQGDEAWWQEAKEHGIFLSEGGFDESAGVYSSDIAIQILDREGRFAGVLKTVINLEPITSRN